MNFRTVLHLLKTDWQRFNIPVIGMWVCLAISATPWLLHDPAAFEVPLRTGTSSSGDVEALGIRKLDSVSLYMPLFSTLALALPVLLSTAIGMHDQGWQAVSPIRLWQRVLAKTLALFLFVVLPLLVPGAVISTLNGFSPSFAISHALGSGLVLLALHGAFAVFGRCCGSFWSWSAAMACLIGISHLLRSVLGNAFVPYGFFGLLEVNTGIWAGLQIGLPIASALLLLAALSRTSRFRPGTVSTIATAVAGLTVVLCLSQWAVGKRVWRDRTITMDSMQPALAPDGIREGVEIERGSGRATFHKKLLVSLGSTSQEASTFVKWQPEELAREDGRCFIDRYSAEVQAAIRATLPSPLADTSHSSSHSFYFDPDEGGKNPSSIRLTGLVFRYRTVADLALGENTATSTRDNITVSARSRSGKDGVPLAEISVKAPLHLTGGGDSYFSYVLHLPDAGRCFELESIYSGEGFSQGGVSWFHLLMETRDQLMLKPGSWKNARLLVLQPEFLGTLSRQLPLPPGSRSPAINPADWMLTRDYNPRSNAYYSTLRPNRPDPATCTEQEFSRYLRSVISLYPSPVIARDLAEYAPRFPRLLALYGNEPFVAGAIKDGVPESSKAEVASAVGQPWQAFRLVTPLTSRGWADLARGPLLGCLEGSVVTQGGNQIHSIVSALARQEDPSTYPALLHAYETTGDSSLYDVVRSLPGIAPELDKVIDRVSRKLSATHDLRGERHSFTGAFEQFRGPVSHGNPIAFAKLLECAGDPKTPFYISGEYLLEVIQPTMATDRNSAPWDTGDVKAWRKFLSGKSASDFAYDRLSRCWYPISKTP